MCAISKLGMPCQALRPQECTRVECLQLLGNSFGRKSWVVVGTEALPQSNLRQKKQGDCLGERRKQPPWKGKRKKRSSSEPGGMSELLQPRLPLTSSREQTLQPLSTSRLHWLQKAHNLLTLPDTCPETKGKGMDPIISRVCLYGVIYYLWEECHTV